MDSAAGAPLEEIRSQAQKEVETNYLIMTYQETRKRDARSVPGFVLFLNPFEVGCGVFAKRADEVRG